MKWSTVSLLCAVVALSACAKDRDVRLTNFRHTGNGPNEFAVVPNKPLEAPEEMAALPVPTPGGSNRADLTPIADAAVALGGSPTAGAVIPGSDAAVVTYAARNGVEVGVRQKLAYEDEITRKRYGRRDLFRIGKQDDYSSAYKRQWLDADAEKTRLSNAGVKTPSAPPPE